MTQKEKALLFKDLCARLPYQPICEFTDTEDDFCTATAALGYSLRDFIAGKVLIKPYLRPMSSMTKEEVEEYNGLLYGVCDFTQDSSSLMPVIKLTTFFYSHHLDCCGLIEKSLALEAPEDMYKRDYQ